MKTHRSTQERASPALIIKSIVHLATGS